MSAQYSEDRTSSNKTGVTLMNSQHAYVIADVMRRKGGVEVTDLPSMIRIDAEHSMEFPYDEIEEALGESFGPEEFEEVMSTHYGRMVRDEESVLFFANPEDAAEYLGFDLKELEQE